MDVRDRIEEHKELITERLDPDFGLLDVLLANRSLKKPEITRIKVITDSYGRSEKVIEYVIDKGIYEKFLDALRDTQQTHLANFILSNGERSSEVGDDWPLTEREISILDTNQRSLVDLLETCDLLRDLYSHKVINNRQRDFVSSKSASHEKNDALLDILRRTSIQNYKITIYCLHSSKQSHLADVLKEGGGVVRVRSESETEYDVSEVEDELIRKFTEMLGDRSLGDSARILECTQLRLIAAKKGNSIILYVFCKSSTEVVHLQEMQSNGKLANVVREMFNEMLSRALVITVRTTFCDEDLLKPELGFPRIGDKDELEESCDKVDASSTSNTAMQVLPLELLDMILGKVYGLSGVFGSRFGQPTDEEIVRNMALVEFCWFRRVTRRRFKNIVWRNLKEFYRKRYKRIVICRNNRSYLVENIQTKSLINKLRSVDCLADVQIRSVNRGKDKSRRLSGKTEELLHQLRSLEESRHSSFAQSLRESKQTVCARVATNGGVVVKAEIQCSNTTNRKSGEQQILKTMSDLRDKTRSKSGPLERQLNRLKAENIEIIDSFLDRSPIVWLWCHSESGLDMLQKHSDLVLTLFNLQSIGRPSAKRINIDSNRFKKEFVAYSAGNLEFSQRLNIKEDVRVRGLTLLRNSIYVLCKSYSSSPNSIKVFGDQHPFPLRHKISIEDITEPEDIGSNAAENSLYITDSAADKCIWKMSASDHRLTKWLSGASVEPFTLSLSSSSQLVMVRHSHQVSSLVIYGLDSELRCGFSLPVDIKNPLHAVETSSGTFMVLHELKQGKVDASDPRRQLWTVSEVTRDDQLTIRRFQPKGDDQQLDRPTYLALDSDEQVFIADTWAERVVHLDSDLNWKRVLLRTGDAVSSPLWSLRVHYDALNHRLMVAGLSTVDIYTGSQQT